MAYLAGLLAAKLRQVDVQLKDTSGALESLQALHENIIQSISGGLITTGLDGRITLVNTAAQKLLERRRLNCSARRWTSCSWIRCPSVESNGRTAKCAFDACQRIPQDLSGACVRIDRPRSKAKLGYVYTFDDLTEIRRLEREVRMQDRLAAVGTAGGGHRA